MLLRMRCPGFYGMLRLFGGTAILRVREIPVLRAVAGGAALAAVSLSFVLSSGALAVSALGPQALGAGVVAAFVTATVGGLFVTLFARIPGGVWGPIPSIAVIYAALCADLVMRATPGTSAASILAALSLAVVLMGALQVLAGALRLVAPMKFLPYPVYAGFLTGLGLLIVWSQAAPLLGLEESLAGYEWTDLPRDLRPGAVLVGVATMAAVWLAPRVTTRVPPLLVGLAVGTAIYHLAATLLGREAMGLTLSTIAPRALAPATFAAVWERVNVSWLLATGWIVLPYSMLLAAQGSMSTTLACAALSEATGLPPNLNRALVGQGLGNMMCGALGGLPIGASISQSVAAARMTEVYRAAPAVSCVALLVVALLLGDALAYVPVAALAGLLITVGIGLINTWTRGLAKRVVRDLHAHLEIRWNLAIVAAVAAAFFFGSAPLALVVGAILAMILLAVSLSVATTFDAVDGRALSSRRVWPGPQARWLAEARSSVRVLRPRGGLFFGTADELATRLGALDPAIKYCVLDFARLSTLDATGCQIVAASAKKLAATGTTMVLAGVDTRNAADRALIDLGLTIPSPENRWFADLDHALEWVEGELLKARWPEASPNAAVCLAQTPLAKGLRDDELQALQSYLVQIDCEPGKVFFKRGDPGSAFYVIDDGLVEIQIDAGIPGGKRLAAFGPGSIFGEVVMFTSGERTADAICVKQTRLFELRLDSLQELEKRFPALYAKVLANLNAHLATRLIAATEVVRAQ
jgi:SulP family sulfate permease